MAWAPHLLLPPARLAAMQLLPLTLFVGLAAGATLPGVTVDEAKWQRLLESNAMEDFESVLSDRAPHVIALANASFAELRRGDFHTEEPLEDFTVSKFCHHVIRAKEALATASIGLSLEALEGQLPVVLDDDEDEIESSMVDGAYEVEADVSLLVNTSLTAYAIIKKGFDSFTSHCWFYGEKVVQFHATFHDPVVMTLNLRLSDPRAEEVDGSGKQVVFALTASLDRAASNELSRPAAMEGVKTQEEGDYGCGVRIWDFDFISWWFPVCTRIDNYLRNNTAALVEKGVPKISRRVLEQLANATKNAVGSSVVIPVQIAGLDPSPE